MGEEYIDLAHMSRALNDMADELMHDSYNYYEQVALAKKEVLS